MELLYRVWDYHFQLPLKRGRGPESEALNLKKQFPFSNRENAGAWKISINHRKRVVSTSKCWYQFGSLCSALSCWYPGRVHPRLSKPFRNADVILQNIPLLHNTVKERSCFIQDSKWSPGLGPILTTDTPWGILISWLYDNNFFYLYAGHICFWVGMWQKPESQ